MAGINKKKYYLILIVLAILIAMASFLFLFNDFDKNGRSPENIVFENDLDIVYGKDSTDITIFMFSSYNCFFCRKFFENVFPSLKNEYMNRGKVKLVVKLVALEKNAPVVNSLMLAVCINEFGDFEKLNELLLKEPKVVYTDKFMAVTNELIEKDEFVAECMLSGESEKYILRNMVDFRRLKCTGTPTFVINNKIYKGYREYNEFKEIIEKELAYALH
ncbi:MAG TPA: thioredoxin domain-containing protein [Bacteroidales bacterium]|nr:thioredoxin domain-containing protein [Bacteroidales bacterium]